MPKRDMRTRSNKQHLGTASNRDAYEQSKSVVIKDSKAVPQKKEEGKDGSDK